MHQRRTVSAQRSVINGRCTPSEHPTTPKAANRYLWWAAATLGSGTLAVVVSLSILLTSSSATPKAPGLVVTRQTYPDLLWINSSTTQQLINTRCGDYARASIRGKGFGHLIAKTYLLAIPTPFQYKGEHLQAYNPSILRLPIGRYLIVFRLTNFHLCGWNGTGMPDFPEVIASRVGALVLDDDFHIKVPAHVVEGFNYERHKCLHAIGKLRFHKMGLDDPRVFWYNEEPWVLVGEVVRHGLNDTYNPANDNLQCGWRMTLCPLSFETEGQARCLPHRLVQLQYLDDSGNTFLRRDDQQQGGFQKNWSPFVYEGVLYLSFSVEPHTVLSVNLKTGVTTKVSESSSKTLSKVKCAATANLETGFHFRGGTPAIGMEVNGQQRYLAVARYKGWQFHHTFAFFYAFKAQLTDGVPRFPVKKASQLFCIADDSGHCERIQFIAGMSFIQDRKELLLTYGANDCEARLAVLPLDDLETLLSGSYV